jgi:hypothetical protein
LDRNLVRHLLNDLVRAKLATSKGRTRRPTSDRVEIVAPERNVSVGILRGHRGCEFSHRLSP